MTSRPVRPRTLLDFINRPILKGVAPAGNLKCVFTGKSGQNRKKKFGRVMYASETQRLVRVFHCCSACEMMKDYKKL